MRRGIEIRNFCENCADTPGRGFVGIGYFVCSGKKLLPTDFQCARNKPKSINTRRIRSQRKRENRAYVLKTRIETDFQHTRTETSKTRVIKVSSVCTYILPF